MSHDKENYPANLHSSTYEVCLANKVVSALPVVVPRGNVLLTLAVPVKASGYSSSSRSRCITTAHSPRRRHLTARVGITAAVATLVGYTTGLFYGFSIRFIYSCYLLGTTVLIICLYIWGQLTLKLTIIKQFNLFYAAHISLLLL
jgi:hypothetical protein